MYILLLCPKVIVCPFAALQERLQFGCTLSHIRLWLLMLSKVMRGSEGGSRGSRADQEVRGGIKGSEGGSRGPRGIKGSEGDQGVRGGIKGSEGRGDAHA